MSEELEEKRKWLDRDKARLSELVAAWSDRDLSQQLKDECLGLFLALHQKPPPLGSRGPRGHDLQDVYSRRVLRFYTGARTWARLYNGIASLFEFWKRLNDAVEKESREKEIIFKHSRPGEPGNLIDDLPSRDDANGSPATIELTIQIDELLAFLDEPQKSIASEYYRTGRTDKEIAQGFSAFLESHGHVASEENVRSLRRSALSKMRTVLKTTRSVDTRSAQRPKRRNTMSTERY